MFSYFDNIVYDMFARDNNEILSLLQPHRNIRVVDQLVLTRNMWSVSLSEMTTDPQQLENILMQINYEIAKSYRQYSEKPEQNRPFYFLREFKSYEFSNFVDAGRQYFRDRIEIIRNYNQAQYETTVQTSNNIDSYLNWLDDQVKRGTFENLNWKKPHYKLIEKNLKDFVVANKICVIDIENTYNKIKLTNLDSNILSKVQNTKSWMINTVYDLSSQIALEKIKKFISKINEIKQADAPVLIKFNNSYHLITDDEQLMMYRALDTNIEIAILEL